MAKTLIHIYQTAAERLPQFKIFRYQSPDFTLSLTWSEVWSRAQKWAKVLSKKGVRHGDNVGLFAPNIAEWEIAQMAIMMCGAVVVGLDIHQGEESIERILDTCSIRCLMGSQKKNFEVVSNLLLKKSIDFISMDAPEFSAEPENFQMPILSEDDIATIVFTSGTTGEPKGIAYTHRQLSFAIEAIGQTLPNSLRGSRTACWLPFANLYQRIINWCAITMESEIFFVENPTEVIQHLAVIQPQIFICVPRVLERIFERVTASTQKNFLMSKIFNYAKAIGLKKHRGKKDLWTLLAYFFFDKLFFKKIRAVFGGHLTYILSGSAPVRKEILDFYFSSGILVLEAYGVSENTVPIACNRFADFRLGSVGKPLAGENVTISSEGEVLVSGVGVFKGYYKDSPRTTAVYHTGDLGHFDQDGFLYLEGRISDYIKTSRGVRIPTLKIQNDFSGLPLVDAVVVLGEHRPAPWVLLSLDLARAEMVGAGPISLDSKSPFVLDFQKKIQEVLSQLPAKIAPAGVLILPRTLSLIKKEITSNLKVRRRFLEEKMKPVLEQVSRDSDSDKKTLWLVNEDRPPRLLAHL